MFSDTNADPEISVVLPVYNETDTVGPLCAGLLRVCGGLDRSFELLWVDDGSDAATARVLDELAEKDPRVRVMHLSRNFGHMAALTAGLENARATGAVICMDSDGQHPAELLPELVARWDAGADIVQTLRTAAPGESLFKRLASRSFYRVINVLADLDLKDGAADFRILDRQVVDVINALPERARFLRGIVFWVGFRRDYLPYASQKRVYGKTKYGLFKMTALALTAVTSFSNRPLRIAFGSALLVALAAVLYGIYVLACFVAGKQLNPGWTSIIGCMLVLHTMELVALAVLSEYLARVYDEQKRRPVYLTRRERPTRDGGNDQ